MSTFIRILIITVFVSWSQIAASQKANFKELWGQVKKFENDGLPKSALEVVEQIAAKATSEKNSPEYIKSLLFKSKYVLILEDEAQLKIVKNFKAEIDKSKAAEKSILQNMLANMYWQYFQQNRYKLYNRSNTSEKIDEDDFRTWDLKTLFGEIQYYYKASLNEAEVLQNTAVEKFSVIIQEQKGSKNYRPTLYDILAQNALEFFKTPENSISKPAYKFEIDNPKLLDVDSKFCDVNIESRDSTSLQLNALRIYQDLVCFHFENENTTALVDVDIDRLNYVKKQAVFSDKDDLFLSTLNTSRSKYAGMAVSGSYYFEIANLLVQQGRNYNPKSNPEPRWKLKEAFGICNSVIESFPDSRAAEKCQVLKKTVLNESLNITSETVIPENQFSRLLVRYTNLNQLKVTIYDVGVAEISRFNKIYDADDKLRFLKNKDVVRQFNSSLKDEGDYQNHSTEIIVPRLKNGHYIILAETDTNQNTFATQTLQVTDFAIVDNSSDELIRYQIINRNNGIPVPNVSAELKFQTKYNGSYKRERLVSNPNGFIELEKTYERYQNLSVTLKKEDRTAYYDGFYAYRYTRGNKKTIDYKGFLFTDRSIYRPGQIVYFKAIAMSHEEEKSSVLPNHEVYVSLYDTNDEEVKELILKTNEFGSVSGEFILPSSGLNGDYYLELDSKSDNIDLYTEHHFSVEEYKRPRFETNFEPVTESFKVNDSISVIGKALAYAGSIITDAKVVYRVKRNVQYPRWYHYYRPNFNSAPQEITNGETKTDEKGEFEIAFLAQPDNSVDKDNLPIFNYEITADVTDINGETRSATTFVNVGYHSLLATVSVGNQLDKTKKDHKIAIDTRNLNGEFVAANGQNKIYKLKSPDRILRNRPWSAPDYQVIPEAEFKEKFPHEAYADEANPNNWERGRLVFESNFDTETSKEITLGNIKKWESGNYIITLQSEDKFGQTVKDETRFEVFSENDKTLSDNELFSIKTNKDSYVVGNNVEVTLGSTAKDMVVTLQVEKADKIVKAFIVPLSDSKQTLVIPVNKEDIGGFAIHCSSSTFNSFIGSTLNINVPHPKTDLEIETLTFRDKLQPGTDETWSFKVKGPQGEKVSVELLASMYDASLDQFKSHNWNFTPITRPFYRSVISLNAQKSFGSKGFRVYNRNRNYYNYSQQSYDRLDWFGFYFGNAYYLRRDYLRSQRTTEPSTFTSSYKSGISKNRIEGLVVSMSDGLPLPGVSVIEEGTANGVQTDFDGKFSIEAKENVSLQFSFIGMQTLSVNLSKDNYYKILLSEDSEALDEVVIVGYGARTKRAISGAVALVETDKIENIPMNSVDEVLRGEAAGVNVSTASGLLNSDASIIIRGRSSLNDDIEPLFIIDGVPVSAENFKSLNQSNIETMSVLKDAAATAIYGNRGAGGVILITTKNGKKINDAFENLEIRKNLQETAFFFPRLKTDAEGNASFSFTTPEALTKWKLQLLAHTKNLESAVASLESVTQKELMVIPNAPRFLRHGDTINISTKIANLTDKALNGQAKLILTNAISGKDITGNLLVHPSNAPLPGELSEGLRGLSVEPNSNTQVSWRLAIPDNIDAVQYKILATTGDFSDGEQNALPVLSNRMLVTETLPMWVKGNESRTFTLDKLKTNSSSTLKQHKLTLEITSNPAWYAVQALPYLMEYPYECNEQTFSRYYANALASHIANSNPRIREVFDQWANSDALISNLEKNQELKSILIQETPWLRDAQSETEQKKRIGLLFDMNKMNNELGNSMRKLKNGQLANGAWPWFKGGRPNRFITQHIISGFGHLDKLDAVPSPSTSLRTGFEESHGSMIKKAINYLDSEFIQEYKDLKKYNKEVDLSKDHLSYTQLHYLYMRSFFPQIKTSKEIQDIIQYYQNQMKKYWLKRSLYSKGLMALVMQRSGDVVTAGKILKSLRETSITSEDLGMYWKENQASWHWYQAPIETQALMVEVFTELGQSDSDKALAHKNSEDIDNLKIWLLKNKQTNKWETTKATTKAVYALLLSGSDWLSVSEMVNVEIGGKPISPEKLNNVKIEAGTGYYKTHWQPTEISSEMAEVQMTKKGEGIAWGALYWQYFEDLDKITSADSPLSIKKNLFKKINTDRGEQISMITPETSLNVGDLVRVRIELKTDRDMEFIHMKDMRASGLEPINVLSEYKYQDGLGYYESTKDASTNFFFDYLPKGVYVFEYDLRVNNAGNMSNGITTVQSMYAPEFSSHSEGMRLYVNN